jgi:hypothetical protein
VILLHRSGKHEAHKRAACGALPFFGVRRFDAAFVFACFAGKTKEKKRRQSAALQKKAKPTCGYGTAESRTLIEFPLAA